MKQLPYVERKTCGDERYDLLNHIGAQRVYCVPSYLDK